LKRGQRHIPSEANTTPVAAAIAKDPAGADLVRGEDGTQLLPSC
jgi:hypothetical protein